MKEYALIQNAKSFAFSAENPTGTRAGGSVTLYAVKGMMKRKCKYVPKAISGINDCGVYKNLRVAYCLQSPKHTQ